MLLFCAGYYNNKSVYIEPICIGDKATGLWNSNCICAYYTRDGTHSNSTYLEPELDASLSDVTYYTLCS